MKKSISLAMLIIFSSHSFAQEVVFPSGSEIWDLKTCVDYYKGTPFLGCYTSPEIDIDKIDRNKHIIKVKGVIVSKIEFNDNEYDSGGYGYCIKREHKYHVVHEVRILEKGKIVADLYPDFFINKLAVNSSESFFEWGGAYFGSAECEQTNKALTFLTTDSYILSTKESILDFGNDGYKIHVKNLRFDKVKL